MVTMDNYRAGNYGIFSEILMKKELEGEVN